MKEKKYEIDGKLNKKTRIVHLSDLHDRPYAKILAKVKELEPNYIVITGDLVDSRIEESKNGLNFLFELSKIGKTFYSLGNHEYLYEKGDIETIEKTGVTVLNNEFVELNDIKIGGLTSCGVLDDSVSVKGRNMKLVPDLKWLDSFEKENGFKILLNHHPEYYSKYLRERNIDLILSGHAHGGQIRLFGRGLFAPGQGIFPKYTEGLYDNKLIVSSGLSNTGFVIPRLFNRREIVVIDIR